VAAVLYANNLRDIKADNPTGIKTLAILLKEPGAKKMYYALLVGSYTATVLLVIFAGLTRFSLLTFLSLPLAIRLIKTVKDKNTVGEKDFATIDARTAQLHSAFSLLFIIALLTTRFR
jgi:1,4-dihydroxy-2-naphthoate octaprenyltransferase